MRPGSAENHAHPALGATRQPTHGAPGPTHEVGLYLWCHLSRARCRAGLVLPRCNTQAMQWHLDEISALVTPGAHAVLIIDRAGWHTTGRLEIPSKSH